MNKNIGLIILALIVLAEGAYIFKLKRGSFGEEMVESGRSRTTMNQASTSGAPTERPQRPPARPVAGESLANSDVSKSAYEVYPTLDSSAAAKNALVAWTVKATPNKDGSATVSLLPHNPEDPTNVYTVKAGEKLYFVEMNGGDDHADTDNDSNLMDDYGIIVNASGIVQ